MDTGRGQKGYRNGRWATREFAIRGAKPILREVAAPRTFFAHLVLAAAAAAPTRAASSDAAQLVYFIQYVGSDYGAAVRDGRVADKAEYGELTKLAQEILDRYAAAWPHGSARQDLVRFHAMIRAREGWTAVLSLSRELAARVGDELDVVPYPPRHPDIEHGRELYGGACAPCHGEVGGANGFAASSQTPPPTSFRASRMALYSPHQIYNAASFGVPGTAMPAFGDGLDTAALWDIAFYVMTLRDGFDPTPPPEVVPLSLAEIASKSDDELLTRLHAVRPGAQASEPDYYRAQFRGEPEAEEPPKVPGEDGHAVAVKLQEAFAGVARSVFPSVVGISVYRRGAGQESSKDGWQEGSIEERLYPGFKRTRAGSGFLVTGDGDILTCADVLDGVGHDDVVDVELGNNVHLRARVAGIEPTIRLALLRVVAPVSLRPSKIGDSDRVEIGHWTIAVGDPSGPERTFVPGTIEAVPERQCYQEHRLATLLQTSIAIDRAGFGGPLVDIHGRVVGLTIPRADAVLGGEGARPVSALPINLVMTIYHALKVKESEHSPWIGISVLELSADVRKRLKSPPLSGLYIDDVFAPSPAASAGVRVGDVLTKMDDHPILGVSDFQTWLYLLGVDAPVTLELQRNGATVRKPVKIAERPASATTR